MKVSKKYLSKIEEFASIESNDKNQFYFKGHLKGLKANLKTTNISRIKESAEVNSKDKIQAYWLGFFNAIKYRTGEKQINAYKILFN